MKKLIFILIGVSFLGCVSVFRSPSGEKSKATTLNFSLYGGAAPVQKDYEFELVNLEKLSQKKIEFRSLKLSDANAASEVLKWQETLNRVQDQSFRYEVDEMIVDVKADDMQATAQVLAMLDQEGSSELTLRKKIEVISSFNERFKDAIETKIEILTAPGLVSKFFASFQVAVEDAPPLQVPTSSFWSPRPAGSVDMIKGAGKFDVTRLESEVCEYGGAKDGYGVHAGMKVKCGGTKLKMKFGDETQSGPLNSRLYYRLGYNVPAIHFVPAFQMKYDRRFFTEINSKKSNLFRITFLGKNAKTVRKDNRQDGRNYVKSAQMKNGSVISAEELIRKLVPNCDINRGKEDTEKHPIFCDYSDSSVDLNFEKEIATLTFRPGSIAEEIGENLGPWHYSNLDHANRSEVRAILLLGALTGNYDLRKDNNKLVWVKETGEIKHFVSDPGSGLGNQANPLSKAQKIEGMKWTTTIESALYDNETTTPTVLFNDYRVFTSHTPFRQVSFADAQWMVRQIASITEDELSEALAASGFAAAEFLLLREKIISIQRDYVKHFRLSAEFKSLMDRKINKKISFTPQPQQSTFPVTLANGKALQFPTRGVALANGDLNYPDGERGLGMKEKRHK